MLPPTSVSAAGTDTIGCELLIPTAALSAAAGADSTSATGACSPTSASRFATWIELVCTTLASSDSVPWPTSSTASDCSAAAPAANASPLTPVATPPEVTVSATPLASATG